MTHLLPEQLVAHRGHRDHFPENSLISILDAIAAGARHIEFDIQFTADLVPVLYHDQNLQRVSGVDKTITEITAAEAIQYNASEPQRLGQRYSHNPVNVLSDLLPFIWRYTHILFYLELKEESLIELGYEHCFNSLFELLKPACPDNLVCISFDEGAIIEAKARGAKRTALVLRDWLTRDARLAETQSDYAFAGTEILPAEGDIGALTPLVVYEIAEIQQAHDVLKRGASAVETFCIRQLLANQ